MGVDLPSPYGCQGPGSFFHQVSHPFSGHCQGGRWTLSFGDSFSIRFVRETHNRQTIGEIAMPTSWYKTVLNQQDILAGKHFKLQEEFTAIFTAMKGPAEMAMFGGRDFVAKEQPYYFALPNGSESLTKTFLTRHSAQSCERPNRSECSLLVGRADAWSLFQED